MQYFYSVISLLAGLGALLMGFKLLSDGVEKLADTRLKAIFARTSKSRLTGVGIGALTTAIIQSSSATTVMVVGFVNAGIMTLYQAAAIIMGANIGTTITAQIVALQSFDFTAVAMVLTFVGVVINMFCRRDKVKLTGLTLAGLGLVFMALTFMSDSMEVFKKSEVITTLLTKADNPLLLLLIGVAVTGLIQSSSAVTGIIISMAGAGLTIGGGGNAVLYVILGTNIGTCVTALLSSAGASAGARRAAMIHLMFNVFGALLFIVPLLLWPGFMENTFGRLFIYPATQIAMFHTFFNVVCTAVFLPFIKYFVKLAERIVPDRSKKSAVAAPIDERLLQSPAIAISQAEKEIARATDLAGMLLKQSFDAFISGRDETERLKKAIAEAEETDKKIVAYLIKISASNIPTADEARITALHAAVGDAVRIGELADNVCKYTRSALEQGLAISDAAKSELKAMSAKIETLKLAVLRAFGGDALAIGDVDGLEDDVDAMRRNLLKNHVQRLNNGECRPECSALLVNLAGNLERAADHLTFIAHSVDER